MVSGNDSLEGVRVGLVVVVVVVVVVVAMVVDGPIAELEDPAEGLLEGFGKETAAHLERPHHHAQRHSVGVVAAVEIGHKLVAANHGRVHAVDTARDARDARLLPRVVVLVRAVPPTHTDDGCGIVGVRNSGSWLWR